MTVASESAPRDCSFCVQTALGQHAEVYSSAPAETLSGKVYVMLEHAYVHTYVLCCDEILDLAN